MPKTESKTLMQRLLDAGYPKEEMYHHRSDLYVFVTPLTTKVIDEWLDDNGYRHLKANPLYVDQFTDQITGRRMYDIAFQYYEEVQR